MIVRLCDVDSGGGGGGGSGEGGAIEIGEPEPVCVALPVLCGHGSLKVSRGWRFRLRPR